MKTKYQLKILGIGEEFEKQKSIYHLLLYFDAYKRSALLSKKNTQKLLAEIGINTDILHNLNEPAKEDMQNMNNLLPCSLNAKCRLIGTPKGVEIVEIKSKDEYCKKDSKYYVVIPGFTADEFLSYVEKLRKHKYPRPFTDSIPLIPYVYYTKYTKDEIIKSIELLKEAGLIKMTLSVFNNETRYKVANDALNQLFLLLSLIHRCRFQIIIAKISYMEKPDEDDELFLMYFFGKRDSQRIIALGHESRKEFQKNDDANKIKDVIKKIEKLEYLQKNAINYLADNYGEILRSDKLLRDLSIW